MARARKDIPAAGTDEAKARRVARVDLSALDERQKALRVVATETGRLAYGERWQTPLAEALGIPSTQVAAWVSGRRPVPPAVLPRLQEIGRAAAAALQDRARLLHLWHPAPGEGAPALDPNFYQESLDFRTPAEIEAYHAELREELLETPEDREG
jgi:hypothetical protein